MKNNNTTTVYRENPIWGSLIPDEQWRVYLEAIRVSRKSGAGFLLGGAFGLAAYTGRWRNTKDLDFFVLPSDKDRIIDALTKAGFEDYHSILPYDRGWIYRAVRNETIVDTIWQTPNRRSAVDEQWFERKREVRLRGVQLSVIPAEELLAVKLYVLQRDRCDWPDLLNLLYSTANELDWQHVLNRMGAERPLLAGLLQVFNWVSPAEAAQIPKEIRQEFQLPDPTSEDFSRDDRERKRLLDSRPWFAAFQPPDRAMQV